MKSKQSTSNFIQKPKTGESDRLSTSCSISETDREHSKRYGHIDAKGIETLISLGVPFVILDARRGKWDDGKRIATAQMLSDEATAEQTAELIPTRLTLVVVYCSNVQCSAGNNLIKHLLRLGYTNILSYDEGIQEWINSGRPVREIH